MRNLVMRCWLLALLVVPLATSVASAAPGLRVRLVGPAANPDAVGAQLRVEFADGVGPVREVQAGSGYWSQQGAVQVIGTPRPPVAVIFSPRPATSSRRSDRRPSRKRSASNTATGAPPSNPTSNHER